MRICFMLFCCAFPEIILKAAAAAATTLTTIIVNEGLPAIQ